MAVRRAPAVITGAEDGNYDVTYDISMGGKWEIELQLYSGSDLVDTFSYSFFARQAVESKRRQ